MCAPIPIGASVLGTAIQAYGKYKEAQASADYNKYVAETAEQNAAQVEAEAGLQKTQVQDQAARAAQKLKANVAGVLGQQKVVTATMGIGGSVTAEDLAKDTANAGKKDELALKLNADIQSWEIENQARTQARGYRNEAEAAYMASAAAESALPFELVGTLLSGVSQVSDLWSHYRPFQKLTRVNTRSGS